MKKDKALFTRISEEEREDLNELAKKLDIPVSQIVREGVREKIAKLQEKPEAAEPALAVAD